MPEAPSRSISRRSLLKWGAAGVAAPLSAYAGWQLLDDDSPGTVEAPLPRPGHSQSVVQRFGINIQPSFANEYSHFDEVRGHLEALGVRKVRARVGPNDHSGAMPYLESLNTDLGITVHGAVGTFPQTSAARSSMPQQRKDMARLISRYAAMFNSLGGYNEPNGTRFGSVPSWWLDETLTHQKWLWDLVHSSSADRNLANVLVCGPSLHDQVSTLQEDYRRCSVLKPYMERINMHRYPNGSVPSALIDERTKWAYAGVGPMPVVVTETGYNNGMESDAYAPLPPDSIAHYADRLLMEHVIRGNDMYLFELLNNYPPSSNDSQNFWGIIAVPEPDPSTWRPMSAFDTLRRFLALMEDGDPPYNPAPLKATLGRSSDVKSHLVGKRDGSYLLVLWRDVSIWDSELRTKLQPSTGTATVTFSQATSVTVYKPSQKQDAFSTARAAQHSIALQGDLAVLHIAA